MSRYISKLPEPIREYCDGNCGKYTPILCKDGFVRCLNCHRITQEHQSNCTCNSRTVDESGNVVHFEECEKEKDKLDELIEWMEQAVESCKIQESSFRESEMENAASCSGAMGMAYQLTINKAKEIKGK